MVYYFTSNTVSPAAFIYVGKDKVESQYACYSHLEVSFSDLAMHSTSGAFARLSE
jgi:hypothetical protein